MKLSVIILTYNEEINIQGCLESVSFSNDILIVDSGSTDRTREIASGYPNVRIVTRVFDDYAAQRYFALSQPLKHDWAYMIDADERIPAALRDEIETVLTKTGNSVSMYRVLRKDFFMGRWLRRSSGYPTWAARLFKVSTVVFYRDINEECTTTGKVGYLKEHFHHHPFNKGLAYWIERHNKYSSMEANRLLVETETRIPWKYLIEKDTALRRKALKQIAYRLPCRPFLAFVYLYLVKFGFLDGVPGFHYSRMRAMYEYMIELKMKELKRIQKGLPI